MPLLVGHVPRIEQVHLGSERWGSDLFRWRLLAVVLARARWHVEMVHAACFIVVFEVPRTSSVEDDGVRYTTYPH